MYRIYLSLAVVGMLLLVGVGVMGWMIPRDPTLLGHHMLFSVFTGIYLCGLHTMAMFHLIGSAKDMKEAAQALPEYPEIVAAIRRSKMKTFPLMTLVIFVTILTIVLGGGVERAVLPRWVHWITVAATFVLNLYAFWIEYIAIKLTLLLMTVVDYKVDQLQGHPDE